MRSMQVTQETVTIELTIEDLYNLSTALSFTLDVGGKAQNYRDAFEFIVGVRNAMLEKQEKNLPDIEIRPKF